METLQNRIEELLEKFNEIKREIRDADKKLYERWKAGGFLVDGDIISMYPSLEKIINDELLPEEKFCTECEDALPADNETGLCEDCTPEEE
jgi:hypothetical protein